MALPIHLLAQPIQEGKRERIALEANAKNPPWQVILVKRVKGPNAQTRAHPNRE
jgi:hypothetical protein